MVIDFHAHILPGADHGCDGVDMARTQLSLLSSVGVGAVVATPHFYPNRDSVSSFLARRERAQVALQQCLDPSRSPRVLVGAEVLTSAGLEEMEGLEELCIKGTNVILLEMPFTGWSKELFETVLAIRDRGLCPVLAHIDRYDLRNIDRLLSHGVLAQINTAALYSPFRARKMRPYLELENVVALGSDLHGVSPRDVRRFGKACLHLGERADRIFARTAELLKEATPLGAAEEQILLPH